MRKLSYKEMREQSLCTSCGKKNKTPEFCMCQKCRNRKNKARRNNSKYLKKIGICVRCHVRQAEPNHVLCYECADDDRQIKKPSDVERKRVIRANRITNGLCPKCGKEPSINDGLGVKCRAYQKRYRDRTQTKIRRSEFISYGKCYCCGKPELLAGKSVCADCYEVRLQTMKKCWDNMDNSYWKSTNTIGRKGTDERKEKSM